MLTTKAIIRATLFSALCLTSQAGFSVDLKNLPYPSGTPSANEIAQQVYFVNHFYPLKNYSIIRKGRRDITILMSRSKGKRPRIITVERHLNNDYDDGIVQSKDLAIFRSGKLKGTGLLITDYVDDQKSQSYSIWLPSLRKIRRFAEPAHDDAWGGTDFTFGDVALRKPKDEDHALVETKIFGECLNAMDLKGFKTRYLKTAPEASCTAKDHEVYVLRSTSKFNDWWYDYRISYVDTKSFADYRTVFFKDGQQVKLIDRDWQPLDIDDPRAMSWQYWYGKTFATDHETWAVIPQTVVRYNQDVSAKFWTERTLRKIKR